MAANPFAKRVNGIEWAEVDRRVKQENPRGREVDTVSLVAQAAPAPQPKRPVSTC